MPVKITIPVKWEKAMRDLEGDLSGRGKTVSYSGNCKNRRHETAACVSASRVRRMDYRVRVRVSRTPAHAKNTPVIAFDHTPACLPGEHKMPERFVKSLTFAIRHPILTSFASTEIPFRDQI